MFLTVELRKSFSKRPYIKVPISRDVISSSCFEPKAGIRWLISNRSKKYSIRKEGARLKIYDTTANAGITLDKLDFKKGRPVSITAQTKDAEQMYKFQKGLLAIKGITVATGR